MNRLASGHERPTENSQWRIFAAAGLLACWLVGTGWLFWQWQTVGLGPAVDAGVAGEQLVQFDAGSLDPDAVARLQSGQGGAAPFVVVHLRDGGCACNRAADEHFLALQALYPAHDVVFAVSDAPGHAMSTALERLPSLTAAESERLWRNLPATPAVAVFDPAGRPVYLGPYADIARCSTARGGPVEAAVMNPLRQSPDAPSPIVAALGCFCSRGPRA